MGHSADMHVPQCQVKRLQPSVSDSSAPAMRQCIPEVRGGNSVGLRMRGLDRKRGEKVCITEP